MSEEILSFEIIIDAKLSDDTKKTLEDLKSNQETETSAKTDASNLLESEGELTAGQLQQVESHVGEMLGGLDKADIAQIGGMAKNPQAGITKVLQKIGGSGLTKIMGPIGIAIMAAVVTVEVIKLLNVKGGPLNRDWRRFVQNEVMVGLSRVQQMEKELGISQTILTQIQGFKQNNENFTYNSLYDINDSRLARVGLTDREAGVTVFIP